MKLEIANDHPWLVIKLVRTTPNVHFLNLGDDWLFAFFALITVPDRTQVNSTSSEIFRILRLAKNSLICRHFQLSSVGRSRKPDHIASGTVIRLTTRSNWTQLASRVSCSQLSFKPVGRCDRALITQSTTVLWNSVNPDTQNFTSIPFQAQNTSLQNCSSSLGPLPFHGMSKQNLFFISTLSTVADYVLFFFFYYYRRPCVAIGPIMFCFC